ncbi:MAG: CHASE domain-containing protein [Bdellovibrionales bacterium]|nr:CHASE domain-containing protein [Bdellovibrionales bacterium]
MRRLFLLLQSRIIRTPPVAVLILTLSLTATATYYSYHIRQIQRENKARELALILSNAIGDRLISYQSALVDTRSFLTAVPRLGRQEFSRYIGGLDLNRNYPSLQCIGYASSVPTSHGQSTKIVYVEPWDKDRLRFLGKDVMLDEPSRRLTLDQARDSGEATLSTGLDWAGDNHPRTSFILLLPVYDPSVALSDVASRRRAVRGFVFAPFHSSDLFADIFHKEFSTFRLAGVEVFDGSSSVEGNMIFEAEGDVALTGVTKAQVPVLVAGREWTIRVTATPRALGETGWPNFTWVFVLGFFISFLIYIYGMAARRYAESLEQSQSLISLIANSLPALVAYVGRDHRYRYVNRAYQEWYQLKQGELLGESVESFLGPRYEKFFRPLIDRALSGERLEFEYSVEQQGQIRAMRSQYIPDFSSSDGHVEGYVALVADVTEQKAFQDRLRDERRISELVNEVGLSLQAELDLDKLTQRITDVATELTGAEVGAFVAYERNDRGEEELEYTVSGPLAGRFQELVEKEDVSAFAPALARAEHIVRIDDISESLEFDSLSIFDARSYLAVPVVSRSGAVLGGLFFVHSRTRMFTERAEKLVAGIAAQAAVAIDNAKLYSESQSVNRVKDEFLATLSHELRTPMNVILGYSELLQDESLPEHVREHVDAIHRNARAQNQLIADLLDISAIITGKLNFQPQRMSSADAVTAAVANIRFSAEAKGVHLDTGIEERGCTIYGDPTRIQQIIWNLLSNAVKFTPSGGTVKVRTSAHAGQCIIMVSDTGIGIVSEFIPYVFDRFRQEDSGRSRRFGGLGLGLNIVRQLVELHGGSIRVESGGKNMGATFTVTFPLATADQHAEL